jgi:glutamyl/glutaminyl-tRNA synthetase
LDDIYLYIYKYGGVNMDRMLHKPDLNIEARMAVAESMNLKIMDLLSKGWTDSSIGNYLGLDKYTIKRFRQRYNISGFRRVRCPDYSTVQ